MHLKPLTSCLLLPVVIFIAVMPVTAQSVISNKNFSLGSYGRVGAGFAPQINGGIGRSLNLNGMGSIGGRMEEADYLELVTAFHFTTEENNADSTKINVQARLAFYSTQGQLIGNVSSKSFGGITASLPELYAEADHIAGTAWNIWIGAKFLRGNEIIPIEKLSKERVDKYNSIALKYPHHKYSLEKVSQSAYVLELITSTE